ncbi:MAG TPA: LysE family translocator [Thermomicrobiales bacterium]|jgi:threonine/homoserine/homoserine lactone efflux protein
MFDTTRLGLFFAAALILAATPGPGMLYVLARSVSGGLGAGLASSGGTAIGGLCHVIAAALGLSALLATSSAAFAVVKLAGAAYLIYLGLRTLVTHDDPALTTETNGGSVRGAFGQGIVTELLNPKTALFFLAFVPQFIVPGEHVFVQFSALGILAVALNTSADLVVAILAGPIAARLRRSPRLQRGQRYASGGALIALGISAGVSGKS